MATMEVDTYQPETTQKDAVCKTRASLGESFGQRLRRYYEEHIHDLKLVEQRKTNDLKRLEAQRDDFISEVRLLREELKLLQEPGFGEAVKAEALKAVLIYGPPNLGKRALERAVAEHIAQKSDSAFIRISAPSELEQIIGCRTAKVGQIGGCCTESIVTKHKAPRRTKCRINSKSRSLHR